MEKKQSKKVNTTKSVSTEKSPPTETTMEELLIFQVKILEQRVDMMISSVKRLYRKHGIRATSLELELRQTKERLENVKGRLEAHSKGSNVFIRH